MFAAMTTSSGCTAGSEMLKRLVILFKVFKERKAAKKDKRLVFLWLLFYICICGLFFASKLRTLEHHILNS
jgi:hypothetical protein